MKTSDEIINFPTNLDQFFDKSGRSAHNAKGPAAAAGP
jgi:hypothetical protein